MSEPIPKAQMLIVDKLYRTPEERATHIWNLIQQVRDGSWSDWDMVCFCIEFLGKQAVVLNDEEFLHYVMYTSRWVYSAHYSNTGRLYGKPDKDGPKGMKPDANPTGSSEVQPNRRRASLLRKA